MSSNGVRSRAGEDGVPVQIVAVELGSFVSWCMSMKCTIERNSCRPASALCRFQRVSSPARKIAAAPISTTMLKALSMPCRTPNTLSASRFTSMTAAT